MRDTSLQSLAASNGRILSVRHDVDDRDPVKSNHLLKIDVSPVVTVDIVNRQTKVRPVRIRLEDVAPEWTWTFRHRHVEKYRLSARFQDGVCLR
jgi:hypothetical protein